MQEMKPMGLLSRWRYYLTWTILKRFKEKKFTMHTKFLLVGMRLQWEKDGEEMLLGDNTGSKAIMQQLVMSQSVGVGVSTVLLCIYTVGHMYTQYRSVQNLTCTEPSTIWLSRKATNVPCRHFSWLNKMKWNVDLHHNGVHITPIFMPCPNNTSTFSDRHSTFISFLSLGFSPEFTSLS